MPGRKNWFAMAFLSVWLIGWAFAGIYLGGTIIWLSQLLPSKGLSAPKGPLETLAGGVFLLVWFGVWAAFGVLILRSWLWQVTGKEVIEVSDHSIAISKAILGFSRPKEYLAEHITDLRAAPVQMSVWGRPKGTNFWALSGGTLAFDYGAKSVYCAAGADEAEARQIVAMIKARFPALARVTGEDAYSA